MYDNVMYNVHNMCYVYCILYVGFLTDVNNILRDISVPRRYKFI